MQKEMQQKYNDLDAQMRLRMQEIATLNGEAKQLKLQLQRFTDIEKQRDEARADKESMRLAKIELQNQLNEAGHVI